MAKCRHVHALVIISSPAPGVFAVRWCPDCGSLYHSRYIDTGPNKGWSERREWQSPNGAGAKAYAKLSEQVRKQRKAHERRGYQIGRW